MPTLNNSANSRVKRLLIAIVASIACGWFAWYAARTGFARSLATYAALTSQIEPADRAAALSPADAEIHYARAGLLQQADNSSEAAGELERAVQLRPRDYYVWLELGMARDEGQDQEGALRAFSQAVILAPAYAQPRWQLGNVLLRMGRYDEAFAALRRAASSNPALLPNVVDLAWGIYQGNTTTVESAVSPSTDLQRMALAVFFAVHGQSTAALGQFLSCTGEPGKDANTLLDQLLKARAFIEAHQVWARLHGLPAIPGDGIGALNNGGFENPLTVGEQGFGWCIAPNLANLSISVDPGIRQSGARSLRIEFRGNSDPQMAVVSQLVLVDPQTRYALKFWARAKDLISAALPIIVVSDASGAKNETLAQSEPLRSNLDQWREFTIDFTAGPMTKAVFVTVKRQVCQSDPCPAFGALWLDSFDIRPEVRGQR